jgi:DNA-directed RNA polymerase subunit M/transcription elongation factor TFIIS
MKISETVERECCHCQHDLKTYRGKPIGDLGESFGKIRFCVHCGQLWRWYRAPGEMDGGLEKITIVKTGDP